MTIRTRPICRLAVLAAALAVVSPAARAQSLKDLTGAVGAFKASSGGMLETGGGDSFSLGCAGFRRR